MDYPSTITVHKSSDTKVNSVIINNHHTSYNISTNCFFWSIERVENVKMPWLATSAVAPLCRM